MAHRTVPVGRTSGHQPRPTAGSVEAVRLVTWNVNSLKARLERVEQWLVECQPDVVCMQETKLADSAFPAMAFSALGYESAHHGEGRWNGVASLSRVGIADVVDSSEEHTSEHKSIIRTQYAVFCLKQKIL